ncbi:MAG TPA: hypothetical protein VFT04_09765 [Gemmatimonadales bacterium]|nr:hypothetical protein [Gemmatimonadales bacterium]
MPIRLGSALVAVAVIATGRSGALAAQDSAARPAIWAQAGLGVSTANLGGLVAASGASGSHLVSARASFVAENFEGGDEETFDVAILYGRRLRSTGAFRPSASAGIAYVKCEECDDGGNASSVGLALSVEAALWPTGFAGIGLHGFGNVNPIASFAGVAVTIHVGRLR